MIWREQYSSILWNVFITINFNISKINSIVISQQILKGKIEDVFQKRRFLVQIFNLSKPSNFFKNLTIFIPLKRLKTKIESNFKIYLLSKIH